MACEPHDNRGLDPRSDIRIPFFDYRRPMTGCSTWQKRPVWRHRVEIAGENAIARGDLVAGVDVATGPIGFCVEVCRRRG